MMREITYSSIRIGAYEPIRAALSSSSSSSSSSTSSSGKHSSPLVKYASALVSGGVGAAIANPLDLVKTKLQSTVTAVKSTPQTFADIYAASGLRGLYKGVAVTSTRAAVLTSSQLGSYDVIKNNVLRDRFGMQEGLFLHFVASMAAGIITTTAANPIDVIKTRYMADSNKVYASPLSCVVATFREGGFRAFFKGWAPAYWRLGPHTVVSFVLIEKARTFFGIGTI
jgi:hypothetical protein